MSQKKEILKKIKILLAQQFDSPEAALKFFDKNGDGYLEHSEIKKMVKEAEVNRFISGMVATKIIDHLDKDDNDKLNWTEFKKATKELLA